MENNRLAEVFGLLLASPILSCIVDPSWDFYDLYWVLTADPTRF